MAQVLMSDMLQESLIKSINSRICLARRVCDSVKPPKELR